MKKKQLVSALCATVLSASLLFGCGSANSNPADASAADSAEAAAVTQEDKAEVEMEAAAASYDHEAIENAGDITITMMVSGTAAENDFETEILPELVHEKWPNLTLEVTKLPDDNYYTSLKTKLASGECPDIILTQPMYAGQNSCYALAEAGYLTPLNDMDFVAKMPDLSAVTYDGQLVSATNSVSILGTYYNKDIFEKAGITAVPASWDEFIEDCEKIKAAGYTPIVMGDKDQYVLQFGLYQIAANEIYPNNDKYDEQLRTGETSFTDAGTWDTVLEMYNQLYENGYIDASQSLGYGASQAITDFVDGKAAMTFDGSFNAAAILAEGEGGAFERGYFPIPAKDGNTHTATCLSAGYSIYSGSEYIDECKEVIDYWFDGESDVWNAYVDTGRFIVTYGNGSDNIPNADLFAPFISLLNENKGYHWCNQAWPAGTETTMEELFSEMIGGQGTTVEDITLGMQDKFEDLLED